MRAAATRRMGTVATADTGTGAADVAMSLSRRRRCAVVVAAQRSAAAGAATADVIADVVAGAATDRRG